MLRTIALPPGAAAGAERRRGVDVGRESEPVEVVEDGAFELRSRSLLIVIFDPQQDLLAEQPRGAPHRRRVQDVTQMQQSGRRRREPRRHARGRAISAKDGFAAAPDCESVSRMPIL